jgi:tetratricopeptide (TPR) repeat protein
MTDLLQQLRSADSDEARQNAVFAHVIDGLADEVRDTAMVLAVPHWFDQSIVDRLSDFPAAATKYLTSEHLAALDGLGLVALQAGTTYSFPSGARALLLRRLIEQDLDRFRHLSASYSKIFLGMKSETLAADIEGIYHELGADPKSGGRLMLERGLQWKSEPLFQWDALDRLIANAAEQDARGVLDGGCRAYCDLLKLFVPRLRQSPKDEIATLTRLRNDAPDNPGFAAEVELRLGYAEFAIGDIKAAATGLDKALDLCEKADRPQGAIEAFRGLARIALRKDEYLEAGRLFETARGRAEKLGLIASCAHSTKGVAEIDFLQGRYRPAEVKFEQAIDQFRQTGARIGEANTRVSLAQLLALQHRFILADEHIEKAMAAYLPLRQSLGLGNSLKASGIVHYEQGAPARALEYLLQADAQYDEAANQPGLAYSNLVKAMTLLALDRSDEAEHSLDQAATGLARLDDRYGLAMVERERGLLAEHKKSLELAFKLLSSAVATFDALPNPIESAATFVALGRVAVRLGFPPGYDRERLIKTAEGAVRLFEENQLPRRQREAQELLLALNAPRAAPTSVGV